MEFYGVWAPWDCTSASAPILLLAGQALTWPTPWGLAEWCSWVWLVWCEKPQELAERFQGKWGPQAHASLHSWRGWKAISHLSCHPELLSVQSFCFLTENGDHQETHLKIICGTQKEKRESCWYISASLVKNISRHYKVHVINMHMRCLWGRAAFKVRIQQDNIFPCEARNNSESYV